ncbi:tripartite tricarboxylate transporter TctB family protein [Enterovirga rhinocerotis]|uniref:Tripartite tricarboxylate transporter TctB family protein n=1 Tax=Enterovirga rhinocerotis TaxID=1339210 RepID=A0A4R7C681_9HYPH|nr:tripartite tricarboxylate transporter TctB family protein [Enterovirga rhinocerotis]TDR93432.1 tripartite tricarboxylate transporter TctB family protein [Enterovirga rhinocerotis]
MAAEVGKSPAPSGIVKGPQAVVGGLALVALALFALWLVSDLSQGTLRSMGPAMLPRWLAIGVGICGAVLAASGFMREGHPIEPFTLRGPGMVVVGIVFFAVTIRGFDLGPIRIPQLGMCGAGPLAMFIGGFATRDVRWRDLLILALALTAACVMLFGDMLNLPIPLYPQWFSDLYPASFNNDTRMRVTAGILVVIAALVYFLVPGSKDPSINVVVDDTPGVQR